MNRIITVLVRVLNVFLVMQLPLLISAQDPANSIYEGFKNPPESARPRTWWHWTNSNVTKEGITKDLEWMKRSGIGGMHLADVASGQDDLPCQEFLDASAGAFRC